MGVLRDLTFSAIGYGARTLQDKITESKNSKNDASIIDNLMQNNNLRQVLDAYRDSNSIRSNTDKFVKFIDELQNVVDSYKRELA